MRSNLPVLALLCSVVIAAYASSLSGEFLAWDDESLVLENPYLHADLPVALSAFFCSPPRFADEPSAASPIAAVRGAMARRYELGGEYLPVRDLSWWLDARLWSRSATYAVPRTPPDTRTPNPPAYSAFGFHLGNVLLHLMVTLLVWRYVLALGFSTFAAMVTALLFGLHPIHTESVAWIASRKDVLSGVFFLGALLMHVRWRRGRTSTAGFLLIALPLFLLAVMSKSTVMALPLVMILVDVTFFPATLRTWSRSALAYLPFLAIAALFSWLVMLTSASTGLRGHGWHGGSFAANSVLAFAAHLDYLGLLAFPLELRNAYENPEALTWSLANVVAAIAIPALALTALAWLVRRLRHGSGPPSLGDVAVFFAGWFFLTLLPVSNLFVPMNWLRAERYLYLPSVGFCLFVAVLLERPRVRVPRAALNATVAAIALAYGVRTAARNRDWHDTRTVWQVTLAQDPDSYRARVELAACDLASGEPQRTAAAQRALHEVTAAHPELPRAHYLLGLALVRAQQFDEGLAELDRALAADADPTWLANASHAWLLKSQAELDRKNPLGAIPALERARALARQRGLRQRDDTARYVAILYNLALASQQVGRTADAERFASELLSLPPDAVGPLRSQVEGLLARIRRGG